ncbi:unnamed protein product [Lactuca virosa]|uniref:Uncharacterized protein n=1 Tax=Lactuca virosa TaxID=75947 RepID=A0AAU9LX00_9ASTR|nr:unnamed protein product [Lactuca virosa]
MVTRQGMSPPPTQVTRELGFHVSIRANRYGSVFTTSWAEVARLPTPLNSDHLYVAVVPSGSKIATVLYGCSQRTAFPSSATSPRVRVSLKSNT